MQEVIVAKNERTRVFLERLNQEPREQGLKLVYYRMKDGRVVDQVWRSQ